jgi:hypothetical protein
MAGVWLSVALWLWMDDAPLTRHLLESGSDFALKKTSATSCTKERRSSNGGANTHAKSWFRSVFCNHELRKCPAAASRTKTWFPVSCPGSERSRKVATTKVI